MDVIKKYSNRFKLVSSYYDAHNFTPTYTFLDLITKDEFTLVIPEHTLIDIILDTELSEKIKSSRDYILNELLK